MQKVGSWSLRIVVAVLAGWLILRCQARPPVVPAAAAAPDNGINWLTDYDAALKQARASNQLVVVDFYTTWCGPCKMMEWTTFKDAAVRARLAGFVPLKIDADQHRDIAMAYGVPGYPTMLVIDATGKPILGTVGLVPPDIYLEVLKKAELKNAETNAVK